MVRKCIVCGEIQKRESAFNFHRFPKDENKVKEWITACGLESKPRPQYAVVCSRHFEGGDYDATFWPRRILLPHAIPHRVHTPDQTVVGVQSHIIGDVKEKTAAPYASTSASSVHKRRRIEPLKNSPSEISGAAGNKIIEAIQLSPKNRCTNEQICVTPVKTHENKCRSSGTPTVRYLGDLNADHFRTPRRARENLEIVKSTVEIQRKRIRLFQTQNKRLENKVKNYENLLQHLRQQNLLSEEAQQVIEGITPEAVKEVLNRQLVAKSRKYSPEIRAFAITLHFYSASAYRYLRKTFNNLLPHPETIRKWFLVIDGNPGFTKEAFDAIKLKVDTSENPVFVNVVMDEMSIRQLIEYQNGKFFGYIDLGTGVTPDGDSDEEIAAKNAYVIMAVALNDSWKIAVGYFLVNSLTGEERANLLKTTLELLHVTGAICHSITFDGLKSNVSMCTSMGARYDLEDIKPFFPHPCTMENVYTIWDACHMLKLVRNTLGQRKILYDGEGNAIQWDFFEKLYHLQKEQGLSLAPKLSPLHINFENSKQKVKLAVQIFSRSVHDALLYCHSRDYEEYSTALPTAKFCLVFNNVFDILNSRSLHSRYGYSRGLSPANFETIQSEILSSIEYIKQIKDSNGLPIVNSNRKTGFLGLIIGLKCMIGLYSTLVVYGPMHFLLSYKLSQDHLETFFSAIRRRGGHNNNPSCLQFKAAYKSLLGRHQISSSETGNCSVLDATQILHVSSGKKKDVSDVIIEFDDDEHDLFSAEFTLSKYLEDVIKYIAGFVAKKAISYLEHCPTCKSVVCGENPGVLQKIKSYGELTTPSEDVIKICITMEKIIRLQKSRMVSQKNIVDFLLVLLLKRQPNFFYSKLMLEHDLVMEGLNQGVLSSHRSFLIKLIGRIYTKLRLHHESRLKNNTLNINSCRQKLNKLILFKNQ